MADQNYLSSYTRKSVGEGSFLSHLNGPSVIALLGLLVLALIHVVLVWGYTTNLWGDYGLWLHQVERFTEGQTLYKDFYYSAPPLGIWVIGAVTKVFGTDLFVVTTVMSVVFMAIIIIYWSYVVQIVPCKLVLPVAFSGFFLAIASATHLSAPLPLGMYNPAAPIGFLCLIFALTLAPSFIMLEGDWRAGLLGGFCGLCILAKQDFWLPALTILMGTSCVRLSKVGVSRGIVIMLTVFTLTISVGAYVIAAGAGVDALIGVVAGFGHASAGLARALPSWRLITIETIVAILLAIGFLGCLVLTKVLNQWFVPALLVLMFSLLPLVSVYCYFENRGGSSIETLQMLCAEVYWHLFPMVLPALVVVAAIVHKKQSDSSQIRLALILFGIVCMAARVRRGFEYVEWYHFLLELPFYVLAVEYFFGKKARIATAISVWGLALIGLHMHWLWGYGLLSRAGPRVVTVTSRGPVYWSAKNAREYIAVRDILNELDPTGKRPVFHFGTHNGALNYFLRRPSPTTITQGFLYAVEDPEAALSRLITTDPPVFLIYNHLYDDHQEPQLSVNWNAWHKPMQPNRHSQFDMPYFARLRAGCQQLQIDGEVLSGVAIYDCAQRDIADKSDATYDIH